MDAQRQKAYKTLNYQAWLDVKNGGTFSEDRFNQFFRIAYAFHNLAESIIDDFVRFDEDSFWSAISKLEEQFGMYHYRKLFNEIVSG